MRRPVGVTFAAIVLGLIALFGILVELAALGVSIFSHSPVIPKIAAIRGVMIGSNLVGLAFFVFCGWTVAGLFRLRSWARIATLVIGGLILVFSALAGIGVLVAGRFATMLPPGPSSGVVQTVLVGIAVFYFLLAMIGLWWLIYFNLKPVRGAFSGASGAQDGPIAAREWSGAASVAQGTPASVWRIIIMIWAWMMLASVLSVPLVLWMRMPMFFFGAVLRGWAGTLSILVLWAVEIYVAVGLLRKWKPAWYLALFLQIYCIGYSATLLLPGVRQRFVAYEAQIMERFSLGMASPISSALADSAAFISLGIGVGLIVVIVLTWALIRRREDYLAA